MKVILMSLIIASSSLFALSASHDDLMKEGEVIYKEACMYCHGQNGKHPENTQLLVNPRDLTKTLLNFDQKYKVIKDGAHYWGAKADIMPSFKSVLNKEQLTSVTHYIHYKFSPDYEKMMKDISSQSEPEATNQEAKMKKWGKKIYKRNCQFCHGQSGKGDGVATKNPVDSIFPYDLSKTLLTKEQIFLYTKFGGKKFGTDKNDMPSWSRKYNDFKLRAVAKYVEDVIKEKK